MLLDWILIDEFLHQRGVQISSRLHNPPILKADNPAVSIVEPHSIPGGSHRPQFDNSPVSRHENGFDVKLSTAGQDSVEYRKGVGEIVLF